MLQAIIVDDEPKVCALIEQLGDWARLDIHVAAVCHDGEDALEKIQSIRPDIVITDIRMPIIDGLELVARTHALGLESAFVIISGYRHFEYAYSAMQYGVVNYLLKPIDKQQLIATLEKICAEIRRKQVQETDQVQMSRLREENRKMLHERFVLGLINGGIDIDPAAYELGFEQGEYMAILINTSYAQLHDRQSIFGSIAAERTVKLLEKHARIIAVPTQIGVICIVNYAPNKREDIRRGVNSLLGQVRALSDVFGDFQLIIALGQPVNNERRLAHSLTTARLGERRKLSLGWNIVVDAPTGIKAPDMTTFKASMSGLVSAIDTLNVPAVKNWFSQWETQVLSETEMDVDALYEARALLLNQLTALTGIHTAQALPMQLDRAETPQALIALLCNTFTQVLSEQCEELANEESRPIRLAKEYVQQNFASNISLEMVAKKVGYSAVYFSTLFKKIAEQGFMDYVTGVRLAHAKMLLKTTQMSIIDISMAVGYQDDKYFRKLFRKETQISPKAYRKLYE